MGNSNSKDFVLNTLKKFGEQIAKDIQEKAESMTGTELNASDDYIPDFQAAKAKKNMNERKIGFVCKSTAGRVVKLIQLYDSTIYTQEPEELSAQWGFVWSKDPYKAKEFIALSTSAYMIGECAIDTGNVYESTIDNNTWAPTAYPNGWKLRGPVGGPFE